MSEHFLWDSKLSSFCIPGYTDSSYCRSNSDKGTQIRAVGILIKEDLGFQAADVDRFCFEDFCELAAITFQLANVSYVLLPVYRPPYNNVEVIDNFVDSLRCLEFLAMVADDLLRSGRILKLKSFLWE